MALSAVVYDGKVWTYARRGGFVDYCGCNVSSMTTLPPLATVTTF